MEEKVIKTKFIVASEEGIDLYRHLAIKCARQKYAGVAAAADLDSYVSTAFGRELVVTELNTFSNQLIVVYVGDEPAGYAFLKGSILAPEPLRDKRNICIAAFEITDEYLAGNSKIVLLEKCLNVCKSYDAIWMGISGDQLQMEKIFADYAFDKLGEEFVTINRFEAAAAIFVRLNEPLKK